jgi:hypothetical protein
MNTATWYSIDLNMRTRENRVVDVEEAIVILRRYVADYRVFHETDEEMLAASLFGFSRSDDEFIEIGVDGPGQISVKVELPVPGVPWLLRPLFGVFQHEETLGSVEAATERIREFFALSADQLRARLRG